jgi:MFS family permease
VALIDGIGLGVFMLGAAVDPAVLTDMLPATHNPLAPAAAESVGAVLQGTAPAFLFAGLLASAAAFLLRLWRSTGVERQQLKWFAYAVTMVLAGQLFGPVMQGLGAQGNWVWIPLLVAIAGIPISIGIAILRYRLYEIDRIISRTLAYGLLTVLLGGAYVGVALGLGQLLGRDSSLVVAAATLAVAALFQPARRRIQAVVDRRFNRRKYDTVRTVEAFSGRLRDELDLDALSAELLTVVDQTMQPTTATLWLRPSVERPPRTGT